MPIQSLFLYSSSAIIFITFTLSNTSWLTDFDFNSVHSSNSIQFFFYTTLTQCVRVCRLLSFSHLSTVVGRQARIHFNAAVVNDMLRLQPAVARQDSSLYSNTCVCVCVWVFWAFIVAVFGQASALTSLVTASCLPKALPVQCRHLASAATSSV